MSKIGVVRPRFVEGMLLTAEDLRLEQSYFNRRLIQIGRRLGWGVLEGMGVDDYSRGRECPTLKVSPGYALDAQGREIVLADDQDGEIVIGKDLKDPWGKIVSNDAILCIRYDNPERLAAGVAGKLVPPDNEAQVVRTVERAQFGFLAPDKLAQRIEDGWVPLAHVQLRGGKIGIIAKSRGLTCIGETNWQHGRTNLPSKWCMTFSAPIVELPFEAVEIRLRDGTGAFFYPDVTQLDLKLNDAGTELSFKLAPKAGETVHIRIACDFIVDWKGQAVSGAHVGGHLPSGNGIAGGVFESWFEVKGKHP